MSLTVKPAGENVVFKKREDYMKPLTIADIKAGTVLVSDKMDEVQSRRRLIVDDGTSSGQFMSVSETGYIMIAGCKPEVLFRHYQNGWKVDRRALFNS